MALFTELVRTAPLVHPGPGWLDRWSQFKYCVRGLALARLTHELFSTLQTPKLAEAARRHPRILSKLQRPYLHRKLGPQRRLAALRYHYDFTARQFTTEAIRELFSPKGFLVAELSLEDAGRFGVRLVYRDEFEKEGELSVVFSDETSGAMLFSLTFCVMAGEERAPEIFVGGLQGCKVVNQRESVVAVTRAMHGLRPKALLVFALQQLAAAWRISAIHAVNNGNHVYRHYRKRRTFAASYDEFWQECGGEAGAHGMFKLPLEPRWRALEEIRAAKRSMYKRRYAMLQDLAAQIQRSLAAAAPETAAPTQAPAAGKLTVLRSPSAVAAAPALEWFV
jgi:uncharacterized protein VirK/YbjX